MIDRIVLRILVLEVFGSTVRRLAETTWLSSGLHMRGEEALQMYLPWERNSWLREKEAIVVLRLFPPGNLAVEVALEFVETRSTEVE